MRLSKLEGVWASKGYSKLLVIDNKQVKAFDITHKSCIPTLSVFTDTKFPMSLKQFSRIIERVDISSENQFSIYIKDIQTTRYDFIRSEHPLLDTALNRNIKTIDKDPQLNFDVFWQYFDDNFAHFEVRNIDWKSVYEKYRPQINSQTTEQQLFEVLEEIVLEIGDRHVGVDAGKQEACTTVTGILESLIEAEYPDKEDDDFEWDIYRKRSRKIIKTNYLQSTIKSDGSLFDKQYVWGFAADNIGYFSIDDMTPWSNRALDYNLKQTRRIMNKVVSDLAHAKGIIVDMRWNDGGWDAVALEIASFFTNQHLKAFTKQAKNGDGFNDPQDIWMPDNSSSGYPGPVVLLCGNDTLSAAEIFVLAMRANPQVTSMGIPTYGSLSDELFLRMPNGWISSQSNEVYTSIDGSVYEGVGVPVDVLLQFDENQITLEQYISLGMDEAIKLLSTSL